MSLGAKFKNFLFEEEVVEDVEMNYGGMSYEDIANLSLDAMAYEQEQKENRRKIEISNKNIASIEEIYAATKLDDLSRSIYKVQEIQSVLPNTLPVATKKESVLGMMKVSNLTLENVLNDADLRKGVLSQILTEASEEHLSFTEECNEEIRQLEARINELKENMIAKNLEQEQQEIIIKNELSTIDSIVNFIS